MGCLTLLLLLVNLVIVIGLDIAFWSIGWQVGVAGIVAILAFLIAYSLSEEVALSPRDFFWNSEWGIFCKKLSWAWGMALVFFAVAYIALAYFTGDPLDILPL